MRAIEAGQLEARRDNRNQWRIERPELDRWTADRAEPNGDKSGSDHGAGPDRTAWADLAEARATIAQLEVRLEERSASIRSAEERAEAAEARTRAAELDRDRWHEMADKLTDRLAERPAVPPAAPRRRWWPWRS